MIIHSFSWCLRVSIVLRQKTIGFGRRVLNYGAIWSRHVLWLLERMEGEMSTRLKRVAESTISNGQRREGKKFHGVCWKKSSSHCHSLVSLDHRSTREDNDMVCLCVRPGDPVQTVWTRINHALGNMHHSYTLLLIHSLTFSLFLRFVPPPLSLSPFYFLSRLSRAARACDQHASSQLSHSNAMFDSRRVGVTAQDTPCSL